MTTTERTESPASAGRPARPGEPAGSPFATREALLYAAAVVLAAVSARALLPENPAFVHAWLVQGAIGGSVWMAVAFALSRFRKEAVGRWLLAILLLGAAANYVLFALQGGASGLWVAGEALGVVLFGTMAVLGLRASPWWLAAGWALHPVWDVALHYFGGGRSFAPAAYPIACITFDLVVAGYIAVAHGRSARRVAATAAG